MKYLSEKEEEILNILWSSDTPLSADAIIRINPDLSISTVQSSLKKLYKSGFITIANVSIHKKALTREFSPVVSLYEYGMEKLGRNNLLPFISRFVQSDITQEELNNLQELLAQKQA